MALLKDDIQKQIRELFAGLERPVKLVMFSQTDVATSTIECTMCSDTRQLLEEISGLSDKVSLEVLDFLKDEARAEQYGVDKIPAVVFLGGEDHKDYGVRMYGIPSGYEFGSLIEDILMVSKGEAELSQRTRKELEKLDKPVHIQVYVTPT